MTILLLSILLSLVLIWMKHECFKIWTKPGLFLFLFSHLILTNIVLNYIGKPKNQSIEAGVNRDSNLGCSMVGPLNCLYYKPHFSLNLLTQLTWWKLVISSFVNSSDLSVPMSGRIVCARILILEKEEKNKARLKGRGKYDGGFIKGLNR